MKRAETVDQYLADIESDAARNALVELRSIIRSEIPAAEEVISYGIPTYKHFGMVVSFAAFKHHCSLFPGHTVNDFREQLTGFKLAKGTIQFAPDRPLRESLVRAIIRARFDENDANHLAKSHK